MIFFVLVGLLCGLHSTARAYAHHETVLALMGDDKLYGVVPPRVDAPALQGLDSTMTGTLPR